MKRLKAAFRWNRIQRETALYLTGLTGFAALGNPDLPLWGWLVALGIWPGFVMLGNVILGSPLDEQ